MELSKNIRGILQQKRWTVAELSRRSGVPRTTLQDWITSQTSVNLNQLKKVAETLEVPAYRLTYGMNEPDPYEGPAEEILKEIFSGRLQVTIHKVESKGSARKK